MAMPMGRSFERQKLCSFLCFSIATIIFFPGFADEVAAAEG